MNKDTTQSEVLTDSTNATIITVAPPSDVSNYRWEDAVMNDYGAYIVAAETVIIIAIIMCITLMNCKLKQMKKEIHGLASNINILEKSKKEIPSNITQTHHITVRQKKAETTNINYSNKEQTPTVKPATMMRKYWYLPSATGGSFRKYYDEESNKTFFRMWKDGKTFFYEFHGNVAKAIDNLNALFDDVCDIQGQQATAINIQNVSPGILDSRLRIIKKATIKLV